MEENRCVWGEGGGIYRKDAEVAKGRGGQSRVFLVA